ncbi:MAG: hypothetical protein JXR78_01570 [Victivallales bacterium]|nr:hypothetical protein [Victivallales bacterium]
MAVRKPLFFISLLTVCGVICLGDDKTTENPRLSEVAESLRKLAMPSEVAAELKSIKFDVKPYFRIVKNVDGKATLIYRCRFTQASSLLNAVESMVSDKGMVEKSDEQNLIIVHDKSERMEPLKEALIGMDVSSPQILVEAKVVEVMVSDGVKRDLSVIWNRHDSRQDLNSSVGAVTKIPNQASGDADAGKGASMDFFPVIAGATGDGNYSNLNVALQWLLKAEDAKILSAPNVIVSRNSTASIVTGTDLPIQSIQVVSGSTSTSTDFKRIGVILNVTPSLINDDYVTVKVNPQVSTVQSYQTIIQGDSQYAVPVISIRNIETELTLKDGQVVMLGGLYTSKDIVATDRTPFLSDIPLIGSLFTGKNLSKEVTQLIFFLKISILTQDELDSGIIYDPGHQADKIRKMGNAIQNSTDIFPKRIDSVEDKINAVMRFKDTEGTIDVVGEDREHLLRQEQSQPQKDADKTTPANK